MAMAMTGAFCWAWGAVAFFLVAVVRVAPSVYSCPAVRHCLERGVLGVRVRDPTRVGENGREGSLGERILIVIFGPAPSGYLPGE